MLHEGDARLVLRLLSSELNRYYFHVWGVVQLVLLAGLMALVCWKPQPDPRLILPTGVMWGLASAQLVLIVPHLLRIGRRIDFLPRNPPPAEFAVFWRYHLAYTVADIAKVVLGLWVFLLFACRTKIANEERKS